MGHFISTELDRRFTYHPPKLDQAQRYEQIRSAVGSCATAINHLVPDCREAELAIEHLEMAAMWANAGIARNE